MKLVLLRTLACGALLAGALTVGPLAQAATSPANASGKWTTNNSATTANGSHESAGVTAGPASPNYKAKPAGPSSTSTVKGNTQMLGSAPGTSAKPGTEAGPAPHKPANGASGTTTTKQ